VRNDRIALRVLQVIAVYGILVHSLVGFLNLTGGGDGPEIHDAHAIVAMGLSLIVIWCILGGLAMYLMRDRFVRLATRALTEWHVRVGRWSMRMPIGWRVRFVLLCIVMAMLEEAVTTSLTNAAPLFGAATDAARITISTNYFEVISNSVVAFIPWFLFWAWFLGRYDFRPLEVMLLFGLTGTLAETTTFGPANLAGVGMWTFVYGFMVYLPVYTVPERPAAKRPRWWHWIVALLLPLIFIIPFTAYVVFWIVRGAVRCIRNAATASKRRMKRPAQSK